VEGTQNKEEPERLWGNLEVPITLPQDLGPSLQHPWGAREQERTPRDSSLQTPWLEWDPAAQSLTSHSISIKATLAH